MTKKLKKKLNRIAFGITATTLGAVTLGVICVKFFVMEKSNQYVASNVVDITAEAEENIEIITGKVDKANSNIMYATENSAEDGAIICDSIVQGARDNELPDGNYIFRVTGEINGEEIVKDYPVELINFYEDVTYSLDEGQTSKTISLGDTTEEYKTLIVKYHKNLNIDEGVTVTATNTSNLTYKKGMYLCVMGELTNNGKVSMTARGTYNQAGEEVYLWKNKGENKTQEFEYIPATGGAGGAGIKTTKNQYKYGNAGTNGSNRATGGGGSGLSSASDGSPTCYSGSGSQGTSYSGGSGGGGADGNFYSGSITAASGGANRRKRWRCCII